jgi:hypothetical protein
MRGDGLTIPSRVVRTHQIIIAALTAGCLIFFVIALVVAGRATPSPKPPIVTYVSLAFAIGAVFVRLILPRVYLSSARRQIRQGTWPAVAAPAAPDATEDDQNASRLLTAICVRLIISAAILEGATFFLLIAYIAEQSPLSLGVAILLIFLMALHFPTSSRLDAQWQDQIRLFDEERAF